jgi:CRP-like cAMP-binding protein
MIRSSSLESQGGNLVLQGLDSASWKLLEPHLQQVALKAGEILEEKGQRASYLYFPVTGGISLEDSEEGIQVALVGRNDIVGSSLLLNGLAPTRAVVMFEGSGWRLPAETFAKCLERRELHRHLLSWLNTFIAEMSQTVRARAQGTIEQRLAYWLLTAAERLDTDDFAISQEMLSRILGVRRAGVTVALHKLVEKKALRIGHRRLQILDRERLIMASGPLRPHTS